MRNLSGLRLARGYALFVPACVPRNSSPPPRCATHCPIFSSIPPQPQYSQNSSVPASIPLMVDPCGSPDRGKSSLYGSIELQILGNKAAERRTGHRQIGTLKQCCMLGFTIALIWGKITPHQKQISDQSHVVSRAYKLRLQDHRHSYG